MTPGPPGDAPESRTPALVARALAKRFAGQWALRGVDLRINEGEVVALLGENGCGKSTLVKILTGVHEPEPGGELWVAGRRVPLPVRPGEHRRIGIGCVYQDLGLAEGLRVLENLFVERWTSGRSTLCRPISWRAVAEEAGSVLASYGVSLDPLATVGELRPTDRALLAIVRAAEELRGFRSRDDAAGHGVLVLDEPTVFLPEEEKIFLFDLVRRITDRGTGVLFVSHDLTAVRQIAGRAEVMRDGLGVGSLAVAETSDEEIVGRISGHRAAERAATAPAPGPPAHDVPAPEAAALTALSMTGGRLAGADLRLEPGEIVGVAGLLGSGSEDLPYALFGALPGAGGRLQIAGWAGDVATLSPRRARRLGMALVPADRKRQGLAVELSVADNAMSLALGDFWRRGVLAHRDIRRQTDMRCAQYAIRPRDPRAPVASLSGGNQQKVVLAKWLEHAPAVLLLHEPTQGVDVATRQEVYELMRARAGHGTAILWVTTDFDELAAVCSRIVICAMGRLAGTVAGPPFSRDEITAAVYAASRAGDEAAVAR